MLFRPWKLGVCLLFLIYLYFFGRRRINRELRHEKCESYVKEVNLNAREGKVNAEYGLCVCVTGGSVLVS